MGSISEKLVFNSVLNFRRVTDFRLCLLETQVKANTPIATRFLRGKLGKDIGLRLSNFCSEMVDNCRAIFIYFLVFGTLLLGQTFKGCGHFDLFGNDKTYVLLPKTS